MLFVIAIAGCVSQTSVDRTQEFVSSFSYTVGEGKCSGTNQTQLGASADPANPQHYILQGSLYSSTPCWAASAQATFKQGKIVVDILTFESNKGQACIQCTGALPFKADLTLKRPLGGELTRILVEQNSHPVLEITAQG